MPKGKKRRQEALRPLLHIFCEGTKTEPNYLHGYIDRMFPGTVLIKIEKGTTNTPIQMIEEALAMQKTSPKGDLFWVVYDRESEVKYSDADHAKARSKAGNRVNIALSNICFEVWLLLHFQPTVAPYIDYEDLRKRSNLRKKYIPDYEKSGKREYSDTEIEKAREHAKRMNAETVKGADQSWTAPHQWNPYTDFYKLLDAIDAFGREYQ